MKKIIKRPLSILLAALMIVSLFVAVPVTASAEVGDYVAEEDYLTFTSQQDESSVRIKYVESGSDFKYNKNNTGWHDYELFDRIELNKGEYVRFRGSDFVSTYYGGSFSIGGKVEASGNIMSLRLDSDSRSQGLTPNCFHMMFAEGCDGLITAPELPETTLAEYCYEGMFENCSNLTTAPKLPATTLERGCYSDMFMDCTSLTELPALPATTLVYGCYHGMFYGCSSIRISNEPGTFSGIKYSEEYRIPTEGTATNASDALNSMFASTGGKFKGTPSLNTTYYIGKPVYTVTWKNGDTVIETDTDVESGATPTFNGTTPEKAEDETNTYTFSGWSPAIAPVSGDVTYTAQFTATPKHTEHTYVNNPTFNWSQDANGDWNCNKLTLTCSGCDATQDYDVTGFFGASVVTCTANTDGSFTYSVSKTVDGTKYEDSKTYDANSVVKSATQLKAAAKKGGSWELGTDLTGVTDVQCANGFVLDGKNHTVTRHANVTTQAVFRTTTNPAEVTLKNLTIDGIAGQSDSKPAIATKQSNPSAGNVINLENVTITNYDFDAANNGVVLAWGQATVNMKNCTVDTDSDYDVWGGAASTINVDGGELGTVYLNGGTASAALTNGAVVDNFATSSDNNIKDNGDGTYTVVPKEYVAQVGSTKYESLAEAITAAQDGGTVKLLADQTIDLQLAAGEEYTIDLNSYTLTVESPQKSYNYIYGDLTIDDSSAAKTGKVVVDDYGIAPRAGGKVTVNSGSFTTADDYPYIFYLMGGELEVNGGTFTAVHPVNCYASGKTVLGGTVVINNGEFTSTEDYVISGFENSNITINGGSFTGPNPVFVGKASKKTSGFTPASATINGGTFTATNDTPVVGCAKGASVVIKGGTFTDGELSADSTSEISVSGGTFDNAVPEEYCANGYAPKDNGNGTYGVGPDTSSPLNPIEKAAADINDGNLFGINCDYLKGTLLGVQKKAKASVDAATTSDKGGQEAAEGSDMRFVAVLDTEVLRDADDYGFVLAKVGSGKNTTNTNFDNLKAHWGNGEKTVSAKDTYNNICGNEKYGDPKDDSTSYKYVTCAVNGVDDSSKVVARFYVTIGGKTYYAKYAGHNYQYTGVTAGIADLED